MDKQSRIRPSTLVRARRLRGEMTDAERLLWQHLRRRQVEGFRFRRQHPVGVYLVDFACLEARLIVELDGGQHAAAQAYDAARTTRLEATGFRVLRFWNHEVLNLMNAVLERIREALLEAGPPSQPFP